MSLEALERAMLDDAAYALAGLLGFVFLGLLITWAIIIIAKGKK